MLSSLSAALSSARLNKVELFPSSLHGYKLLRLESKVAQTLLRFFEPAIKLRPIDWEPRYNLTPVTVSDIQTVAHAAEKPAAKKGQPKAAEAAKPAEPNAPAKAKQAEERKNPES